MIEFQNVSYTYPFQRQKALTSVSFTVNPGEAVLCTGASGCGKSTLIRLINGLAPHFFCGKVAGKVLVTGKNNAQGSIHDISRRVGTMFQDPEQQFFALNVEDELAFALECQGMAPELIDRAIRQEADRFKLSTIMDAAVFDLSEGEKQKVALAAILTQKPDILILDEPSANLDTRATHELAQNLAIIKKEGITLFIVDHRLYWLKNLIDRVFILKEGRIAAQGNFSLIEDPMVQRSYGLRKTRVKMPTIPLPGQETGGKNIEIREMSFGFKNKPLLFDSMNLLLPRGAVTAVTGGNGVGKTTFARLLLGLVKLKRGTVLIDGRAVPPRILLKKGSIVLQNADHQLHMKSVRQELEMSVRQFRHGKKKDRVDQMLARFGLNELADRHPQSLSGGQKQRLVIACGIIKEPEILILDEPTSGLDRINMDAISTVIKTLAKQGTCVLVITHDLELIEEACSSVLDLPQRKLKRL